MSQFSSGKHEKIAADPEPWTCYAGWCSAHKKNAHEDRFAPNPEFDRPLTNPANPILRAARLAPGANIYYRDLAEWPDRATIDHANAVLSRLATLKES